MNTEPAPRLACVFKALAVGCAALALWLPAHVSALQKTAVAGNPVSSETAQVYHGAMYTGDTHGMPFVILDKKNATMHVFSADGRLRGSTPVLIGSAIGDESVQGVGDRQLSGIRPSERTTPAGRFISTPGRNASGEDIVWVDYEAAVSMHRVRAKVASERRLQRLASPTPDDNRISFGCINIPPDFYNTVVRPLLGNARGVVYILPETRTASAQFGSFDLPASQAVAVAIPTATQGR
jgi:hypothetical protein